MIVMRTTGRHGNPDYGYFFWHGVLDHICDSPHTPRDSPYSSIGHVEDAVAEH